MKRCGYVVQWLELNATARCVLPEGHLLPHSDGLWAFDSLGIRVPADAPHPLSIGEAEQIVMEATA